MENMNNINLKDFFLSLSHLLDVGDKSLEYHQMRTAFISWKIGESLGLSEEDLNNLIIAGLVHDIGALSLEDKISLRNFEFEKMDIHAYRGYFILNKIKGFEDIALAVKNHHKSYSELKDMGILAQIINLSDSIERSIDREKNILDKRNDIIKKHKYSKEFHPQILAKFLEISSPDKFWVELVNPRISEYFYDSPLNGRSITKDLSFSLSYLIRDIIDFKSPFTLRHSIGVMFCVEELGERLKLSEEAIDDLRISALLHDVGKIIVPTEIIMKPSPLDKYEKAKMNEHPYYTYLFLKEAGYPEKICKNAAYHHEELEGRGYPFRLNRNEIHKEARLIAVSDVFVALYEERPYRKALPKDEITKIMKNYSDHKLDKDLVDLILESYESINDKLMKMNHQLDREYELFNEIEKNYESTQINETK